MTNSYVVANCNEWFAEEKLENEISEHDFHIFRNKEQLTVEALTSINPRYVFFPHWNWKVPEDIFSRWECVVFHAAPLPYGRGGSPIQNLIQRGFQETPFHALRMEGELDAGPIYLSRMVSLAGSLGDIFVELSDRSIEMMREIIDCEPEPKPQMGEAHLFERRTPEMSEIYPIESEQQIFDKIRMVDFGNYPRAFIPFGDDVIEFTNARFERGNLFAEAKFRMQNSSRRG